MKFFYFLVTMDKKVASKSEELHKLIDSLSTNMKGQIDTIHGELMAKIEKVTATCTNQQARLTSLEDATSMYSDKVVDMETQVLQLKKEVSRLQILGIKEKFEGGSHPTHSVAKLLQEYLGLDTAPHWSGHPA